MPPGALDVSDPAGANAPADAAAVSDAAANKREENRKKRERQKAKKRAEAAGDSNIERWKSGKLPGGRAERKSAGPGRGMGVFALEAVPPGDLIAAAQPALSVVFDEHAASVCSFCFAAPPAHACGESEASLKTGDGKGFGIVLDDYTPPGASEPVSLVTCVTKESPNRAAVRIGDRVVAVEGAKVTGKDSSVAKLLEAAKAGRGESGVSCTVARPALLACQGCHKSACCASCIGAGAMAWHAYECKAMQAMPGTYANAKETSTLRMLLRYKMSTMLKEAGGGGGAGEWHDEKEPTSMLATLQGNATDVPVEQLQLLARLSGVTTQMAASLIYQVRTNACEVRRHDGKKAACALSALMGWHNHDCTPNAKAEVREDGCVALSALRGIKSGEEITISYIDVSQPFEERQKTLRQHYGFECRCGKCLGEQRSSLKSKMRERDGYLAQQRAGR